MEKLDNGFTKWYNYDAMGNVEEIIYENGDGDELYNETYIYNYTENKCTFKDGNGKNTVYYYDNAGNLLRIGDHYNYTIERYTYDNKMRPSTVTSGRGVTEYGYDERDRVTLKKVLENGAIKYMENTTYSYSTDGLTATNVVKEGTDSASLTTITKYDKLGRVSEENNCGDIYMYEYDMQGNLKKERGYRSGSGDSTVYLSTSYTYDALGNVLTAKEQDGNDTTNVITNSSEYDMLGRVKTVTDGLGNVTEYSYYDTGWLRKVTAPFDGTGSSARKFETVYSYNTVGRNTRKVVKTGDNKNSIYVYEYDDKGNMEIAKIGE